MKSLSFWTDGEQETQGNKNEDPGTSLVDLWLRLHALNTAGLGSNPGQGTRFYMSQLRPGEAK